MFEQEIQNRWLPATHLKRVVAPLLSIMLAACGGEGSPASGGSGTNPSTPPPDTAPVPPRTIPSEPVAPVPRADGMRFLQQATFGPTQADLAQVQQSGYARWIDAQMAMPFTHTAYDSYLAMVARVSSAVPNASGTLHESLSAFWNRALTAEDQLRWRVAYSLSQIFVVSYNESQLQAEGFHPAVVDYADMLARGAFGSFRSLLGNVALHPVMGEYLNSLGNQKEDMTTGRLPDENFAREIMQLFSIGLVRLNDDGTSVRNGAGQTLDTYTGEDVSGLARVFTGLGLDCPEGGIFPYYSGSCGYAARRRPMRVVNAFHSTSEKRFLGTVIPANTPGNSSINTALDVLANHPNTAPFISRQLIQRLVTSNPSPAYVRDVVAVWRSTDGNLGQVVKAILLHPEARETRSTGRIREPLLRFTHLVRALSPTSYSGLYMVGQTNNPASQLGMNAFFAPSVFNFYRPGYIAPGSESGAAGMVAPEMQMASEVAAAGWVNFVKSGLELGWGRDRSVPTRNQTDVDFRFQEALPLAAEPERLLDYLSDRLLVRPLPQAARQIILGELNAIRLTTPQGAPIPNSALTRVRVCVLLIAVTPHFQVES